MENNVLDGPRVMLPKEYEELLELTEISYGLTRTYCLNHYPLLKKENILFENHFVIKEEGRLISQVGLFPMQAVAGESEVKVGGIGGIATHPDYQGKGYMRKLLDYSILKMREKGVPLSILGGDTQRYRRFGWETAGKKIVFSLNKRSVSNIKTEGFLLRGYEEEGDLDRVIKAHKKESLRIKRLRKTYQELLKATGIQIWIGEEDSWCYAILSNNEVVEFGGEPSMVAKLFAFLLNHYPLKTFKVHFPYLDNEMLRALYQISFHWEVLPLYMIKINDLKKTIFSFREQIESKAAFYEIKEGTSITLRMENSNQEVSLIMRKGVEICNERVGKAVSLSDIEMVRLLFGPSPEKFGKDKEQKRLLNLIFPLDFYIWGPDKV